MLFSQLISGNFFARKQSFLHLVSKMLVLVTMLRNAAIFERANLR